MTGDYIPGWVIGNLIAKGPTVIQSNLKQGDVKIGDQVRMWIAPGPVDPGGFVEGTVAEMASSGGVVGIQIGGVWFSSGLRSVLRVEPAEYARTCHQSLVTNEERSLNMSTMDHTPKSGFLADRDDLSWLTVDPVPEARREIHPRFRTNWAAITVVLFALMLGLLFGIGIGAGIVLDTVQQHSSSNVPAGLPACETEDSTGCYWDAETQGNGAGIDLVTP